MNASVRIEFSEKFKQWVVRKLGIYRDDLTLHNNLFSAVMDAEKFLRIEQDRHQRSAGDTHEQK